MFLSVDPFAPRYLAEEEKVVAPYQFGVYDLLVLPPSFPYGGMVWFDLEIYVDINNNSDLLTGKCLFVVFDSQCVKEIRGA